MSTEGTLTTGTDEAAVEGLAGAILVLDGGDQSRSAAVVAARRGIERLRADPAAARAVRDAIDPDGLRTKADRLCNAYADKSAAQGLARSGHASFESADRADDVFLCALQDTRTAIDGRERPHRHVLEGTPDAD